MGSEWKRGPIGEFVDLSQGLAINKQSKHLLADKGLPLLRITDLIDDSYSQFIIKDKAPEKCIAKKEDIIYTRTGQVGLVYKNKVGVVHNNCFKVIPKDSNIHTNYLFWFLRQNRVIKYVNSVASGSVQKDLNHSAFKTIPFILPPLQEQKAIAHILGTLDDKIELNRKMNETLEEMAQALFKSWFVDFDPVLDKALAAGHEIPEPLQATAGKRKALGNKRKALPQAITDLFPDRFVFTEELGWMPEGWEVKSVTEAIKVNPRTSLKQGEIAKYADMKALPESGFSIEGVIEKEFKGGAKFIQKDILLARITPCLENGKTGLVDFLGKDEVGFGSTEFIVLREKGDIKSSFIACLSRNTDFRSRCIQSMVGSSGRQRVQHAVFDFMFLALPSNQEVLNYFNSVTDNYFYKISENSKAVESLSKLRDSLLPKLISGELKLPELEKMQFE